jgi:hypothetical protein
MFVVQALPSWPHYGPSERQNKPIQGAHETRGLPARLSNFLNSALAAATRGVRCIFIAASAPARDNSLFRLAISYDARSVAMSADRNLLFAVLALQADCAPHWILYPPVPTSFRWAKGSLPQ